MRKKTPPLVSLPVCYSFWLEVWSGPLHAQPAVRLNDVPQMDLPRWPVVHQVGPRFLQRWVAQAVANRLAWQESWISPHYYRYGRESDFSWERAASLPAGREALRGLDEEGRCWLFGVETEYLLRLVEPGSRLSAEQRLLALAGTCWRIAQLYAEWKRRYGWRRARELVREALSPFLELPAEVA